MFRKRRVVEPTAESTEAVSPLVHLYSVLADVLRDQVASQMEQASTNDLKSVGILGAALAMVVALLLIRATDPEHIAYWWWYPMPLFVFPCARVAMPLRRSSPKRAFLGGPSVPQLLARFEAGKTAQPREAPYTLEEMLAIVLVDLHTAWRNNDSLLAEEQRSFYWGAVALGIVTLIASACMLGGCRERRGRCQTSSSREQNLQHPKPHSPLKVSLWWCLTSILTSRRETPRSRCARVTA
jgi:hypothetical protein